MSDSDHDSPAAVTVSPELVAGVQRLLVDTKAPICERFRAIFTLSNLGGPLAIDALVSCMNDSSALLRHEIAFVLGQMKDEYAIPFLTSVLENTAENSMVRHEAGEALGAIGNPVALPVLQKYSNDPLLEVAETCQLAIDRINWCIEHAGEEEAGDKRSKFHSVDPAPPIKADATVDELRDMLVDEARPMFERYGAMFALRDIGTEAAVDALAAGFGAKSALLRHEIAFVFGQLQHPHSVNALSAVLSKTDEHPMVRHEAAEALGSIATPEVLETLQEYLKSDKERVVRESCAVALDIVEYFSSDSFQYADGVAKVTSA